MYVQRVRLQATPKHYDSEAEQHPHQRRKVSPEIADRECDPDDDDDDDDEYGWSATGAKRKRNRGGIHQRCAKVIDTQVGAKWDQVETYLKEKYGDEVPTWELEPEARTEFANRAYLIRTSDAATFVCGCVCCVYCHVENAGANTFANTVSIVSTVC